MAKHTGLGRGMAAVFEMQTPPTNQEETNQQEEKEVQVLNKEPPSKT